MDYEVTASSHRRRVVLAGRGIVASRRSTRSRSSRPPSARGSTTPPTSAWSGCCGSPARSPGARSAASLAALVRACSVALDRSRRAPESRRWMSPSSARGSAGSRQPTRCVGEHRVTVFERDAEPGGHVKTVTVDAADGAGRGRYRVHRLQRAHVSAVRGLLAELAVEDASPATCRSGGRCRRVRDRVQLPRPAGSSRRERAVNPRQWRMLADVRRFYARCAVGSSTVPSAAASTLGRLAR